MGTRSAAGWEHSPTYTGLIRGLACHDFGLNVCTIKLSAWSLWTLWWGGVLQVFLDLTSYVVSSKDQVGRDGTCHTGGHVACFRRDAVNHVLAR